MCCSLCPRSYHYTCLDPDAKKRSKGKMHFSCPQHQCVDCQQKTGDAGGMLYRCRWCERAYCEDCVDWDKTDLLGENIKEYEILGFPAVAQAYYIKCPDCADHHIEDKEARLFCQRRAREIDEEYQEHLNQQELIAAAAEVIDQPKKAPSSTGSLTDAPTLESSGVSTPRFFPKKATPSNKQKRKWEPGSEIKSKEHSSKKRSATRGPVMGMFIDSSTTKKKIGNLNRYNQSPTNVAKRRTIG